MRTDSTRISKEMQVMAKDYILRNYGEDYYPSKPNMYGAKGSAQDAHEAIRPSSVSILLRALLNTWTKTNSSSTP